MAKNETDGNVKKVEELADSDLAAVNGGFKVEIEGYQTGGSAGGGKTSPSQKRV